LGLYLYLSLSWFLLFSRWLFLLFRFLLNLGLLFFSFVLRYCSLFISLSWLLFRCYLLSFFLGFGFSLIFWSFVFHFLLRVFLYLILFGCFVFNWRLLIFLSILNLVFILIRLLFIARLHSTYLFLLSHFNFDWLWLFLGG